MIGKYDEYTDNDRDTKLSCTILDKRTKKYETVLIEHIPDMLIWIKKKTPLYYSYGVSNGHFIDFDTELFDKRRDENAIARQYSTTGLMLISMPLTSLRTGDEKL